MLLFQIEGILTWLNGYLFEALYPVSTLLDLSIDLSYLVVDGPVLHLLLLFIHHALACLVAIVHYL